MTKKDAKVLRRVFGLMLVLVLAAFLLWFFRLRWKSEHLICYVKQWEANGETNTVLYLNEELGTLGTKNLGVYNAWGLPADTPLKAGMRVQLDTQEVLLSFPVQYPVQNIKILSDGPDTVTPYYDFVTAHMPQKKAPAQPNDLKYTLYTYLVGFDCSGAQGLEEGRARCLEYLLECWLGYGCMQVGTMEQLQAYKADYCAQFGVDPDTVPLTHLTLTGAPDETGIYHAQLTVTDDTGSRAFTTSFDPSVAA